GWARAWVMATVVSAPAKRAATATAAANWSLSQVIMCIAPLAMEKLEAEAAVVAKIPECATVAVPDANVGGAARSGVAARAVARAATERVSFPPAVPPLRVRIWRSFSRARE